MLILRLVQLLLKRLDRGGGEVLLLLPYPWRYNQKTALDEDENRKGDVDDFRKVLIVGN